MSRASYLSLFAIKAIIGTSGSTDEVQLVKPAIMASIGNKLAFRFRGNNKQPSVK